MSKDDNLTNKIYGIYDLITNRNLYVNSNLDVLLGDFKTLSLDSSGQSKIYLPTDEAYNSTLLFSLLVGLTNNGSLLLVGPPGCGKTTTSEYVGHFVHNIPLDDILIGEIQGHPEQTEEKMVARFNLANLMKDGIEKVVPRKFFETSVKIIDEFTRLPPKGWSILTRILDTGIATYGDEVLHCAPGPLYATSNFKDDGNYTMTPSTKDRFDLAVMVAEPNASDFEFIASRGDTKLGHNIEKLLEIPAELKLEQKDRNQIQKEISEVKFDQEAINFMSYVIAHINFSDGASDEVVRKSKGYSWQKTHSASISDSHYSNGDLVCNLTENGVSTRTMQSIERYSKALAWFRGEDVVTVEDVKIIIPYATWHKVDPTPQARDINQKYTNDRIGLMKHLVTRAGNQFIAAKPVFEHYGEGVRAYVDHMDGSLRKEEAQKKIYSAMEGMATQDDPVKFSLAVQLTNMYHQINKKKE